VFKKQTGESLIACFNRMKAKQAAKLLRETAKPVTDIATELGFKETKYFDTVFKKFHGISPVQYSEEAEKHRN
jgi:two-component system response regulator YesN